MPTVSNASPLIALAAIDRLELLPALFGAVVILPAVLAEISPSIPVPAAWMRLQLLAQSQPTGIATSGLGAGEREALSLGLELRAERVILDAHPACGLLFAHDVPSLGNPPLHEPSRS